MTGMLQGLFFGLLFFIFMEPLNFNPLAAEFFCYSLLGMEIILLHTFTWHGVFIPCLLFGMDFFFGTHVSLAEN